MTAPVPPPGVGPGLRRGGAVGAAVGLALGGYIDWYFTQGPGSVSVDAGEAHGLWAMLAGFPFSLVGGFAGRPGLVMSVGLT